jgi:bacterioferritin-associated ferredoxin
LQSGIILIYTQVAGSGNTSLNGAIMYVCVCSAVTDRQIHEAVDHGASSLCDVQNRLPVGMCCGRCQETARACVDEYILSGRRKNAA